ncbi:MAG: sigma-E factor negative regulatory protein [Methylophilaceae bacterium]|nr:MAG: sigma-E factor negative regulatory protein [Methylophilaceae bacterium]
MKNQLSALIDGEFDIEESEHILTALKADGELKEAWKHYHLIGDAMRGSLEGAADYSANIIRALEAEPTVLAVNKTVQVVVPVTEKQTNKTPVIWSVAASVAAVMFVGLMVFELQFGEQDNMAPVELANSVPMEYLQAHQSMAPSSAAYYIQSANYTESYQ